jgi:hypothetical protein
MEKLMVHVHQVLVHEGKVAPHEAIKITDFVCRIGGTWDLWENGRFKFIHVAWIDKNQAVSLAAGIAPHVIGAKTAFLQVRDTDAFARPIEFPAVIGAFDTVVLNDAKVQWNLPMRAAVFQGKYLALPGTDQQDWLTGKGYSMAFALGHFFGPGNGIPEIRIDSGFTNVR